MLNFIWSILIILSIIVSLFSSKAGNLSTGILNGAAEGVKLVISLAGSLMFWSGIAEISEKSGFSKIIQKILTPLLSFIFPELEKDSAAFSAIAMNVSANLLCLGNAATPLGLKAMGELKKISSAPNGTASYTMIKFVLMNTASLQLIPTTAAAIRAEAGSTSPFDITVKVWITSALALTAGLLSVWLFSGKKARKKQEVKLNSFALPIAVIALKSLPKTILENAADFAIPLFLLAVIIYALAKKVKVFDEFKKGAENGITTAKNLLPVLVGLVTAVTAAQTSGLIDVLVKISAPFSKITGIPKEIIPLCIIRPFSGSGAVSVYKNILSQYGADSTIGRISAIISGSSETTFYAMSVYFGSVDIKKTGTTALGAIIADITCFITASKIIG